MTVSVNLFFEISCGSICWLIFVPSYTFREININIPRKTRRNGTLYLHVYLYPARSNPFASQYTSIGQSKITTYTLPKSSFFNLLQDDTSQVNFYFYYFYFELWNQKSLKCYWIKKQIEPICFHLEPICFHLEPICFHLEPICFHSVQFFFM